MSLKPTADKPKLDHLPIAVQETVVEIVGYFLDEWDLIVAAYGEEKIDKLSSFILPKKYETMGLGHDIIITINILIKELHLEGQYKLQLYGFYKVKPELSFKEFASLLKSVKLELEQNIQRSKLSSKKLNNNTIQDLALVVSDNSSRYLIVVDGDFENTIEVDGTMPTWKILLRIAEGEKVQYQFSHKSAIDYLNSNRHCKIYVSSEKELTKILKVVDGYIRPGIGLTTISEKAYKQRLRKLKPA